MLLWLHKLAQNRITNWNINLLSTGLKYNVNSRQLYMNMMMTEHEQSRTGERSLNIRTGAQRDRASQTRYKMEGREGHK